MVFALYFCASACKSDDGGTFVVRDEKAAEFKQLKAKGSLRAFLKAVLGGADFLNDFQEDGNDIEDAVRHYVAKIDEIGAKETIKWFLAEASKVSHYDVPTA